MVQRECPVFAHLPLLPPSSTLVLSSRRSSTYTIRLLPAQGRGGSVLSNHLTLLLVPKTRSEGLTRGPLVANQVMRHKLWFSE